MSCERLAEGAVHYAAGPIGRMSHGLRVVVTAPEAKERRREVVNSVRASFLFLKTALVEGVSR